MRIVTNISIALLFIALTACGGGGGSNNQTVATSGSNSEWLVDTTFVRDGGPGKDGIPSIDNPKYIAAADADFIFDDELVIGTNINGVVRAFPHKIMNWHEVVNVTTGGLFHALSYCPLTGSAAVWTVPDEFSVKTFGVSGLLYNSNLIMYDRETDSNWPQMLNQSANGQLIRQLAVTNPVVETSWGTWKQMYPETTILSTDTGITRDYNAYPYGSYLTDDNLLFQVSNSDGRLQKKTRVLGVADSGVNQTYEIANFTSNIQVINESVSNSQFVVIGSSSLNFAVAFDANLADGTSLTFTALDSALPVVMEDNEGNQWDAFGQAVSGPRAGQSLQMKDSFIAFWFAWVAFHPNPTIGL